MHIRFTRSGGWPPPLRCRLDEEVLAEQERAGARALLARPASSGAPPAAGADRMQYDIVLEREPGEGAHHVRLSEADLGADPRLRALVRRLEREAPPPW